MLNRYCVSVIFFGTFAFAAAPSITIEGKKLALNGSGFYTATLLAIKVYELSLFLEKPTLEEREVRAAGLKVFRMTFLRDLPEDKFRNGWVENHNKRCKKDGEALPCLKAAEDVKKMLALFKAWTEGTTYDYVIAKNKLSIYTNGVKQGTLESTALTDYLTDIWVGTTFEAPLRENLLGLKS